MMLRRLPFVLQKRGAQLLHRQCTLWGHDVRRPEGNLLLRQGFERVRPPNTVSGCSQYTLPLEGGLHLQLWGFGFFIGDAEGVYVNRYSFLPRHIVLSGDVWEAKYFAHAPCSQDYMLFARGLRSIIQMEKALLQDGGLQHRERCLLSLDKSFLAPHPLLREWRSVERAVRTFAGTAQRHAARAVAEPLPSPA